MKWWLKRRGWLYDHGKRMWWRHRSECCNAPMSQKVINPNVKGGVINYRYGYFCDNCGEQAKSKWEFKHK